MGEYILQVNAYRGDGKSQWMESIFGPFDTLEEAKACLAKRHFPENYRIAEAYTVTRYRPVKI